MALVQFQDNTPPYLNAENLNNNFNELNNKPIYNSYGVTTSDLAANTESTLYSITLPAGEYMGYVFTRNQGGGTTPYRTFTYLDSSTIRYVDASFTSLEWGNSSIPIIINIGAETTLTVTVKHDSGTAHKIDSSITLIKIK